MTAAALRLPMDGPIKASIDWVQALESNRRWLATVVHARLADHQAAEDVLQEVALAALRQTSKPTDPTKVAPWLSALAASLLLGLGFYGASILPTPNTKTSNGGDTATAVSNFKNEAVPFVQYSPIGNTLDSDMKMLVSGPNKEKSEIPIYDLNAMDHDVFVAKENYEVAKINQRLRREGFELDVRPEYYTGKLNDGRQLIVPVKHVGLKPYGL